MRQALIIACVLWCASAAAQTLSEVPDDHRTPGVVGSANAADVCGKVHGKTYTKRHRSGSVEASLHCPKGWQADHRVPLSVGGADVTANLWCQPPNTQFNWHDKDRLDVEAWIMACRHHTMNPSDAQAMFLAPADWRLSYCRVFPADLRCATLESGIKKAGPVTEGRPE